MDKKNASKLTARQLRAVANVLAEAGMSDEMLLELIRKDERKPSKVLGLKDPMAYPPIGHRLAAALASTMKEQPIFLYTRPEEQVEQMRRWNAERGWNIPETEFEEALRYSPKLMPDMPHRPYEHPAVGEAPAGRILILVPYLEEKEGFSGFERTCKEVWAVAKKSPLVGGTIWNMEDRWKKSDRPQLDGVIAEARRYRDCKGYSALARWPKGPRLEWHSVETDAWYFGSQKQLNTREAFRDFSVLCAYAHHPRWAHALLKHYFEERRIADVVRDHNGWMTGFPLREQFILGEYFRPMGWGSGLF